jgi:hypothetical protein
MAYNDEDLRTAARPILVLALGGDPVWDIDQPDEDEANNPDADAAKEQSPRELLEKAMAVAKLQSDPIDGADRPPVDEPIDVVATFTLLRDTGILDFEDPGSALRTVEPAALEQARIRARAMWDLANFAELVEYRQGKDTAGLGLFSKLRKRDLYFGAAWITRYWILIGAVLPAYSADSLIEALSTNSRKFAAIIDLVEAFPGYKPFLTSGGEERLAQLSAEEREEISHRLSDYIHTHPDGASIVDTGIESG